MPSGRTRPASSGASSSSGLARMLATTTSKAPSRNAPASRTRRSPRSRPRWPGWPASPADRRRRRKCRPPRASPLRSQECRNRSRSRARAPRAQDARRASAGTAVSSDGCRYRTRVPGSIRRLIAPATTGSHHDGTIHSRSLACIGANCTCVLRTQSVAGTGSIACGGGGLPSSAPRRTSAPSMSAPHRRARSGALPATKRLRRRQLPRYRARQNTRSHRACRRLRRLHRPKARRPRATRPTSVRHRPQPHRRTARDTPLPRIRRSACASPSAARGSGSTCRRAGTTRRAAAPDAAECWS